MNSNILNKLVLFVLQYTVMNIQIWKQVYFIDSLMTIKGMYLRYYYSIYIMIIINNT